ncbi:hypothetical protein CXB51_024152 [Gossypium anomalum]|uniref:Uncharacterized protein n=1 Tax=Gossypium anomalum TaxID=47600 RepID=A0A8J5Y5M8_9ROSI|nr:hypothetical protein CXB51_024152 [Gossypium anomalum]
MMKATTAFKVMNQELIKHDRFDGLNFNWWKDKMLFLLTVLNVAYVLNPNLQPVEDLAPNANPEEIVKVPNSRRSTKKTISNVKDTSSTPCLINCMLSTFQCNPRISIMDQVHELQILVSRLRDLKVVILKLLQVGVIILKLPFSWNNYRKKLLHMAKDFTMEKILRHLCIEEEIQKHDVGSYGCVTLEQGTHGRVPAYVLTRVTH